MTMVTGNLSPRSTETFVLRCGVYADEAMVGSWTMSVLDDSLALACRVCRWDAGMWWELKEDEMEFKDNKGNSYSAVYQNGWWRTTVPREKVLPDSEFWPSRLVEGSGQYVNSCEVEKKKVPSNYPWPEPEIEEEPEGVVTPFAVLGDEHDRPIEEVKAEMKKIVEEAAKPKITVPDGLHISSSAMLYISAIAEPLGGKTFAKKPGKMRCMGCGMVFDIEEVNVNIKYTSENKLEYDLSIFSACCSAPLSREKPPEVELDPIVETGLPPLDIGPLHGPVVSKVKEKPSEPPKPKKPSRKKRGYACPVCGIRTTKSGKLFASPRSVVIHARMAHGERLKEAGIKKG